MQIQDKLSNPVSGQLNRFSAIDKDHRLEMAKAEAKQLGKAAKDELFVPDIFRGGGTVLKLASDVDFNLSPEQQKRIDAYQTLIKIGLRSKKNPVSADDTEAFMKLAYPTPALKKMMDSLNLTRDDFARPVVDADQINKDNDIPPEVHERARKLGLYSLKIPKEHGGQGLTQKEYAKILETFVGISGSLGSVISAQSTIGSAPLLMYGTPEQQAKYLKEIAKGDYLVAFGLTEPKAGSDLKKLSTTATLSPDGQTWTLNGEKLFITNVSDAGLAYFVTGKTMVNGENKGPAVFMVDLPFKVNETWEQKKTHFRDLAKDGLVITPFTRDALELMMIRGSDQSFIQFKDFKLPANKDGLSPILGQIGEGSIIPLLALNKGRAGFGPYVSAQAEWLAVQAMSHALDREMFDMNSPDPNRSGKQSDLEYVQGKIGNMQIRQAMGRAASDMVSALIDANPGKGVGGLSALIKVLTTEDNWRNAVDTAELYGGGGLIIGAPNQIERSFRDAWIPRIVEGVNIALKQLSVALGGLTIQKELMGSGVKEFKKRLKENPLTIFTIPEYTRFVKGQLGTESGALPWQEAFWLRSHMKWFSRVFGVIGLLYGNKLANQQHILKRVSTVLQDFVRVIAAQTKLAKYADQIPAAEKLALQAGTEICKKRINRNILYMATLGTFREKKSVEVGKAYLAAHETNNPDRPNTEDELFNYLREKAAVFHDSLKTSNVPWMPVG